MIRFRFKAIILGLLLALVGLSADSVWAERAYSRNCSVFVKSIRASGRAVEGVQVATTGVNPELEDVREQLASLPFRRFDILDDQRQAMKLHTASSFSLKGVEKGPHTLAVTPHAVGKKKVHVTVDWRGSENEDVLSTKLRMRSGKNIVLGADATGDISTIMCVKVECE